MEYKLGTSEHFTITKNGTSVNVDELQSEMSVADGTGANADKTTITLKSGTSATVLKSHQDISGKQDTISDLSTIRSGAQAGSTAYQKPQTGIPSTDMSSAVQTSLGKADSALQSHQDISGKADKATTIAGYGITDAYTKTEVNNLVTTPNQGYVTVSATAQTTAATDVLPATGSADTIYRVSSWDGTQYTVTSYSEYAWDGTQYQFLCKKSQLDEVFDITVYNSNTKYADLKAALGTNGANVPQELRKGGMSVKFVQSSDNKYVQYFLTKSTWSTVPSDWSSMKDLEEYLACSTFIEIGGSDFSITGYIATNGGLSVQSPWVCTDFIPCNAFSKINICGETHNNALSAIAFYDENKVFIKSIRNVADAGTDYEVIPSDIPTNAAFVRLSSTQALKDISYCKQKVIQTEDFFKQQLSTTIDRDISTNEQAAAALALAQKIQYESLNVSGASGFSIQGYVATNGKFNTGSGWYRTDYLPIVQNIDIKAIGDSNNPHLSFIAFYKKETDGAYTFISSLYDVGVVKGQEYTLLATNIPSNATHIIVSTASNIVSVSKVYQRGQYLKEKIDDTIQGQINEVKTAISGFDAHFDIIDEKVGTISPVPTTLDETINGTNFGGTDLFNNFGVVGTIYGIRAKIVINNSAVDVYCYNIETKEKTLIYTIPSNKVVRNTWNDYLFDAPFTLNEGYAIGIGTASATQYNTQAEHICDVYYTINGTSWQKETGKTTFLYKLIRDNNFVDDNKEEIDKLKTRVTTIEGEVIPKTVLWNIPSKIYLASDTEFGLYNNTLVYPDEFVKKCPFRIELNEGYYALNREGLGFNILKNISEDITNVFKVVEVNNGAPFVYNTFRVISQKSVDFIVKSKVTNGTPNVLVISDSFIDAGYDILTYIDGFAQDDSNTINWVGTHQNSDGQMCEAYAGASEESFLQESFPYQGGTQLNPFYISGGFNMAAYLANNNISVDKVVILLGSNTPSNATVKVGTWIQKMINGGDGVISSIKDALPNVPIFVCMCMPYLSDCNPGASITYGGWRQYHQNYRMLANQKYFEYFDNTTSKVYVVPMLNFHPNYGYSGTDLDEIQFNEDNFPKIRTPRDIHPTASGSKCIAYNIYQYLKLAGM